MLNPLLRTKNADAARDRSVEADYFQTIVARDYVISADGKHENPDDDLAIHFTYPTDELTAPTVGKEVQK